MLKAILILTAFLSLIGCASTAPYTVYIDAPSYCLVPAEYYPVNYHRHHTYGRYGARQGKGYYASARIIHTKGQL